MVSLFCCYAPEDASWQEQFEKHLAMLKQLGWVQCWSERDIPVGANREQAIEEYLSTADLLLLFISADFLSSAYGSDSIMQEVVSRQKLGEVIVIPVLLRPVDWKKTPLGILQVLPRDGRPVTMWSNPDEAFTEVAEEIRAVIEALRRHVALITASSHQTLAQRLADDLSAHHVPVWQQMSTEVPTDLKESIREASAVVMIASSETVFTLKEAQRLSETYQRPIVKVWISADEKRDDRLPASLMRNGWVNVDSEREDLAFLEIRRSLNRHRRGKLFSPVPPVSEVVSPRNPYKGLHAFTAEDSGDFFGRTAVIDTLLTSVETLQKKGQKPSRLLAVVGASGSGKSSVVKAGLLPALQLGLVFDSNEWVYLAPIVPGTHPIDALLLALSEHFPEKTLNMLREDLLDESTRGLHLYATLLARRQGCTHVVLVIDQFEEVFTPTTNEKERQQFFDLVVTACTQPDGPLMVVLTLRADFYDRPMQYPALYTLMTEHLVPLLPMELPDLRTVITQPARLPDVQLTFEENLVGDMLFDIQGQIGALPLLQFTLDQLFVRREGRLLTVYAYREIGGIRGALTKHAEETYLALPSQAHRELTRTLFLRLIDPGMTEQETTRRRAARSELELPDAVQTQILREALEAFTEARLLTTNQSGERTTVEVSHEALIREWRCLSEWLHEAREDIRFQQALSEDVAEWERRDKPNDRLYRGTQLAEAQIWAQRNKPSADESAFLKISDSEQKQREAAEYARRVHEQRLQRLTKTRTISLFVAITVFVLLVVIFAPQIIFPAQSGNVTNLQDDGPGSLRQALKSANPGSTITFDSRLTGTIVLMSEELIISKNVDIKGPGAGKLAINGNGKNRIFNVKENITTTISGLTITNGFVSGTGGGVYNAGTLTLTGCVVSYNRAIAADEIDASGGGVFNDPQGTLTLTDSIVSHNHTSAHGGGISNSGIMALNSSSVFNNFARRVGGGINNALTLRINNSTISQNSAEYGGGILMGAGGEMSIYNSTFYVNIAKETGGNIMINGEKNTNGARMDLLNTIVAGGQAFSGPDIWGTFVVVPGSPNLIENPLDTNIVVIPQDRDRVNVNSVLVGVSPRLGPLQNNAGPTPTHALLKGSPAVDSIGDGCIYATDQRGVKRPQGKACDIGAYELEQ
jgi:TIR domain/AAA ATPase domain